MNLCADTLRDVLEREVSASGRSSKEALKAVRQKLHNIVAPYLGDPEYPAAERELAAAFASADPQAVRAACAGILSAHASTRERISILDEFYPRIFAATGKPAAILDVACGLNPLTFPWMGLPLTTRYHAYDIHGPRVEFLNRYFRLQGLAELAQQQDVLVHPPEEEAEVALLFKEAHRFEQRQRGCNAPLWDALRVRYLLVSLPTHSLSGRFRPGRPPAAACPRDSWAAELAGERAALRERDRFLDQQRPWLKKGSRAPGPVRQRKNLEELKRTAPCYPPRSLGVSSPRSPSRCPPRCASTP